MRTLFCFALASLVGCSRAAQTPATASTAPSADSTAEAHGDHAAKTGVPEGRAPLRTADDGSRVFGRELADGGTVTALASILATPADYDGKSVRTEGTIAQVCQKMGCWIEIQAEGTPAVRVPMAGHSFFLPPDVAGHRATVEGTVKVAPLDEATKQHLEAEGAKATGGNVSISATTVLVAP